MSKSMLQRILPDCEEICFRLEHLNQSGFQEFFHPDVLSGTSGCMDLGLCGVMVSMHLASKLGV